MTKLGEQHVSERRAVAEMMHRLCAARLTTLTGGNVSLRIGDDLWAISPAGGDKSQLTEDDIAIMNLAGGNLIDGCRPSSEYKMHLEIYRNVPRVRAIVHAHPPTATAFTTLTEPIDCELTAEGYAVLGRIEMVPYAITGSQELAVLVARHAANCDSLLLENHGALALGATLIEAFSRMEVIEAAAWQTFVARLMGGGRRLNPGQLGDLDRYYGKTPA